MNYFFKAITIVFLSIFVLPSEAMDQNQGISEEILAHLRNVYKKTNTMEETQQVMSSNAN